jgi:N-acetyl-alpha-D-muramate 1-phosphate uridylyltransferase
MASDVIAMLFAAGRGERMRPLTDVTPKPLLKVGGKALIVWHIERLKAAGVQYFVINTAHLGQKIVDTLGNGNNLGVHIQYSREELSAAKGALETAGGIAFALPLLKSAPFIAVSADIYCDYDYSRLVQAAQTLTTNQAYCVLVNNPEHHPEGDFGFDPVSGKIDDKSPGKQSYTFSGMAAYHPSLFASLPTPVAAKLAPLLRQSMASQRTGEYPVRGEIFGGQWIDVGTPERLAELDKTLTLHRPN